MLAIGALYSQSFRDDRLNARCPPRHLDDADLDATCATWCGKRLEQLRIRARWPAVLGLLADTLVRRGRCPPVGQIASANAIDGQTRVVKYQPLYSRVKAVDGGVVLQFASLSINAGSDHEAAMRFVSR